MSKYRLVLVATLSFGMLSYPVLSTGESVHGYVTDSVGGTVMNEYGECWRTSFKDSDKKLARCGYKQAAPEITLTREIRATRTAASDTVIINEHIIIEAGILFDVDSADLSADGKAIINERIARFRNPGNRLNIHVIGHTDSTGPEAYNQALSERRAQSVADYIERLRVSPDAHVRVSAMGETDPIASNDTSLGREANRRVMIEVSGTVSQ